LKHTTLFMVGAHGKDVAPCNVFQYKLVQAPRFELETGELKVRCDTVSPYLDCLACFLRALLLLRCEPAFRLLANTANIFLGFILLLL
jgi:hypothetical protein